MSNVEIDQDVCSGCGVCTNLCGDVFEPGDDGKAEIVEEYQGDGPYSGEIPDDIDCVEEAAESCPVEAISVE